MHQFIFNELSNIGLYNRQKREDFVIATKVRGQMGDGVNDIGLGRKHIMASCEASLKRLQTNYIDLYQVIKRSIECYCVIYWEIDRRSFAKDPRVFI